MVKVDAALRSAKLDAIMLLQIHDELIFEIATERAREGRATREERDGAWRCSFRVPVEATIKVGSSWYDIAAYDPDEVAAEGEEVA